MCRREILMFGAEVSGVFEAVPITVLPGRAVCGALFSVWCALSLVSVDSFFTWIALSHA